MLSRGICAGGAVRNRVEAGFARDSRHRSSLPLLFCRKGGLLARRRGVSPLGQTRQPPPSPERAVRLSSRPRAYGWRDGAVITRACGAGQRRAFHRTPPRWNASSCPDRWLPSGSRLTRWCMSVSGPPLASTMVGPSLQDRHVPADDVAVVEGWHGRARPRRGSPPTAAGRVLDLTPPVSGWCVLPAVARAQRPNRWRRRACRWRRRSARGDAAGVEIVDQAIVADRHAEQGADRFMAAALGAHGDDARGAEDAVAQVRAVRRGCARCGCTSSVARSLTPPPDAAPAALRRQRLRARPAGDSRRRSVRHRPAPSPPRRAPASRTGLREQLRRRVPRCDLQLAGLVKMAMIGRDRWDAGLGAAAQERDLVLASACAALAGTLRRRTLQQAVLQLIAVDVVRRLGLLRGIEHLEHVVPRAAACR